jgi:hypothetical protein
MTVMIVHGVESPGLYLVNRAVVQLLHRSFAFDAVTCLEMILLPQVHFETGFKDGVRQGDAHTVLFV